MQRPLALPLLLMLCACRVNQPTLPADLIIHNAIIYTVNDQQPKALAVRDGRRLRLAEADH